MSNNKINIENYQAYFLDFVEGNLTEKERQEVIDFIALHPELKSELDEFENISLEEFNNETPLPKINLKKEISLNDLIAYTENLLDNELKKNIEKAIQKDSFLQNELRLLLISKLEKENITYAEKNSLKKSAFTSEELISYIENTAPQNLIDAINNSQKTDSNLAKELNLYLATKLNPSDKIIYADKSELKRETKIVPLFGFTLQRFAAAAAILLFFGLAFYFFNSKTTIEPTANNKEDSLQKKNIIKENVVVPAPENSIANITPNDREVKTINNKIKKQITKPDSVEKQNPIELPFENNSPNNALANVNYTNDSISKIISEIKKNYNEALLEDKEVVASNIAPKSTPQNPLKPAEFAAIKLKSIAWDDEDKKSKKDKKFGKYDLLALMAKGLKKLGLKNTDAKIQTNSETDEEEYVVSIVGIKFKEK